jgi:uncharacterized protein YndB with AHSA1/START domain
VLEPLIVEFTVQTEPDRAFDLWAKRTSLWWPPGHRMASSDSEIVFEGHPGGRIYERSSDGVEHGWGEVLEWEPPNRLRYLWHIFFDRSEATTVEVRFDAIGTDATTVTITQTGFERLGDAGPARREKTGSAWVAIAAPFVAICGDPAS